VKYISEKEQKGTFHGFVYQYGGIEYVTKGERFQKIVYTEKGWTEVDEFIRPEKFPLLYRGRLYSVCKKELEQNILPLCSLPRAFKTEFEKYDLFELDCRDGMDWVPCTELNDENTYRLRVRWVSIWNESGIWKFVDNDVELLQNHLDKDIVYTKNKKYYLQSEKEWFLVDNKLAILQKIDQPYFSLCPLIPVWIKI